MRPESMTERVVGADPELAEIEAQEKIRRKMEMSLAYHAQHPDEVDVRLDELDSEWDLERAIQVCGAGLTLGGVGMGFLFGRKWLLLPGLAGWFLLQFALRRETPPIAFLRKLGIRTRQEIEEERAALQGLRGGEREEGEAGDDEAEANRQRKGRKKTEPAVE